MNRNLIFVFLFLFYFCCVQAYVTISIRDGGNRRAVTTVKGLPQDNLKRMLLNFKKECACSGSILHDDESGEDYLEFRGDQRINVQSFLVEEGIAERDDIKIL